MTAAYPRSSERQRVDGEGQRGILVEQRAGLDARTRDFFRCLEARVERAHRAERELAAGAGRPELRVLEHLAHRIDTEDAANVDDQRLHLRRLVRIVFLFLRIEEMLLLQD